MEIYNDKSVATSAHTNLSEEEIQENQLLQEPDYNLADCPTPSLDQTIYGIAENLLNLSVDYDQNDSTALSWANSTTIEKETANPKPTAGKASTQAPKRRLEISKSKSTAPINKRFKSFTEMFPMAAAVATTEAFVVDILHNVDGVQLFTQQQGKLISNAECTDLPVPTKQPETGL